MRIASWNINGIKARAQNLIEWLKNEQPDILCLQEIKSTDENFPVELFADLGYHIETYGQKSFNGVAIFSKSSPIEVKKGLDQYDHNQQARYIEALFDINNFIIRIASIYCPNGNPIESEKYHYKCDWMENFIEYATKLIKLEEKLILIGDYNIIPTEKDAKYPERWTQDAVFLPKSRSYYHKLLNLGFIDAIRAKSDDEIYTFWDYQARSWEKNNGIRIDHALVSPEVINKLKDAYAQKETRAKEKPSDHVPIWLILEK
ncbi:exodeoxyribonuclease III [Bartonella sp. DGB1]|uniref:exodeoxyribonuclease III n=1 Tax=Bartonella sp. DGB1 TaxID=3239807 RepID=UPI003525B68F